MKDKILECLQKSKFVIVEWCDDYEPDFHSVDEFDEDVLEQTEGWDTSGDGIFFTGEVDLVFGDSKEDCYLKYAELRIE